MERSRVRGSYLGTQRGPAYVAAWRDRPWTSQSRYDVGKAVVCAPSRRVRPTAPFPKNVRILLNT